MAAVAEHDVVAVASREVSLAGATGHAVVPLVAEKEVLAWAAEKVVLAWAAEKAVIAKTAIHFVVASAGLNLASR